MKKILLLSFVLVTSFTTQDLLAQSKSSVQTQITKVESGLIPAVRFEGDSLWNIEGRMKHYRVPGLSLAVIKDSKIVWIKNYGIVDQTSRKTVTNQTLFQAGSISKTVSAYAALREVRLGKIKADENVNVYLKSWKIPDNEFTVDKKVNLKNLLSHSGGLTVSGFLGYAAGLSVPSLKQVLDGEAPANSPAIRVDKAPGGYFRYSGGGYTVMQQMLIDIEGKEFPQLMNELVLRSLGMKNSTFNQPLSSTQLKFAATGYLPDGSEVAGKRHTYPEMAAAGLWTTTEDLAKFIVDIQQTISGKSQKVISQKLADELTKPYIESFEGLGVFLENKNGQEYFNHGGWDEGFSSKIVGSKHSGDGVAILTNGNQPMLIEEIIRSVAEAYNWPSYNKPVNKNLAVTATDIKQAIGRYATDKYGVNRIYEVNGKLFGQNNMDNPMQLYKISEDTYAIRDWDFKVKFLVNPADQKKNLVMIREDGVIRFEGPALEQDQKSPFELIKEGYFDSGLSAFLKAKTADPNHNFLNEGYLNNLGYQLLRGNDVKAAIDIFRVNTFLYPTSENVYDSLGEAYQKAGNKKLAKENYAKVLTINPKNTNAAEQIKILE